jgi:beta-galactosidase GanA
MDEFVYGAQYYRPPTPPRAERKKDIMNIRKLGFNTIKIQAMWNWVNPQPDIFDFEEIHEIMDAADQNGIGVIILTNLENCPYWLAEKHPDARYVGSDGEVIHLQSTGGCPSGGWPGLCFDNEPVREAAGKFLKRMAEEFKRHPALFRWHAWEEPHLEPIPAGIRAWQVFCCCESTLEKFQGWLKKRYKTILRLNETWHTKYSEWEQVRPPARWLGCYSLQMDWMRFQEWNLAEIMAWRVKTIKDIDKTHQVISHLGSDCPYSDLWKLAKPVDAWGCSLFPQWKDNILYKVGLQLDTAISSANGKTCYVGELQADASGPLGSGIFISSRPSPKEIAAWNWLAVAHGLKGVLYWQYRPETLGPEAPGFGLCDVEGKFTDRSEVASKISRVLNSHSIFMNGKPPEATVGILYSKDALNLLYCATGKMFEAEPLSNSFEGIYQILWRNNIPVRLVHIEETPVQEMKKLKAIYSPLPLCMGEEQAEKIKQYVKDGGTLISECHVAQYNVYGYCSEQVPGAGLHEVFGCTRVTAQKTSKEKILFKKKKLEATAFRETYKTTTGKVTGTYSDGAPAVIENIFQKGAAVLFGSLVFENQKNSATLLDLLPNTAGPKVDVEPCIFARTLTTDEQTAVILVNTEKGRVTARVRVRGMGRLKAPREIWLGKKVLQRNNSMTLTLEPLESAVLFL